MSAREVVNKVSVTGPITLGDLRWLVTQCEGQADESSVSVQAYHEYNAFDRDPEKITVYGRPTARETA